MMCIQGGSYKYCSEVIIILDTFCRYGNMDLHVGDTISGITTEINNLKCGCRIPPFVTCMKKPKKLDDLED